MIAAPSPSATTASSVSTPAALSMPPGVARGEHRPGRALVARHCETAAHHLNNLYPACISRNRRKRHGSTRAARAWHGRTAAPLSAAAKEARRRENAVKYGATLGVGALLLGASGPVGWIVAGLDQRVLSGHGAGALVRLEHLDAKDALAEPGQMRHRRAIARAHGSHGPDDRRDPRQALVPDPRSLPGRQVHGCAGLGPRFPIRWRRDPVLARKEPRLGDQRAADPAWWARPAGPS